MAGWAEVRGDTAERGQIVELTGRSGTGLPEYVGNGQVSVNTANAASEQALGIVGGSDQQLGDGVRAPWRTVEQVELATLEWVWWWNNQRLHGELDMRTPLEVETAHYADLESAHPAPAGQASP